MTQEELLVKIKAEIERLKDENNNIRCDSNKAYCQGYDDALVDLLASLSTLESEKSIIQEQSTRQRLEEEYKDYVENDLVYSKLVNRNVGFSIAQHFAKWGAEHLKK